jgi:hypothetical protein
LMPTCRQRIVLVKMKRDSCIRCCVVQVSLSLQGLGVVSVGVIRRRQGDG